MSQKNEPSGSHTLTETPRDEAACSPGCACHAAARPGRARWLLGVVILVVAAVLVTRAVMKRSATTTSRSSAAAAPAFGPPPSAGAAARTIAAQGNTIGLFTLKPSSADDEPIAAQMALPGVMALVKGRGMKAVSGEITETKLVQAYVAASTAGGGCGAASGGCGPSGCK